MKISKTKIGIIVIAIISVIVLIVANPISYNDAENRQVIQHADGDMDVRFAAGYYVSGAFAKIETWPNNFTIQISKEKNRSEFADLWCLADTTDGRFSEGDNCMLEHTVKWDLPSQKQKMIDLHTTYSNVDNLMSTTLLSYQKKIATFSTQRMSSEAHYSGGKSQLDDYFQDQLRNGQVLLQTATKTRTLSDNSEETYVEVKPILDKDGELKRTESDIQVFGILSTYTSMDNVHYANEIEEKLRKKIQFAADKANSKQELIAAEQAEATAVVKGRELIAVTTATEEAAEAKAVIQARKAKLVSAEKLEEDKNTAASTLALKEAEAKGDRLKVQAGLSPLEAAEIERDTRIGVAEALSKRPVPSIVNGGGGGGSSLADGYSYEQMLLVMDKLSKKK